MFANVNGQTTALFPITFFDDMAWAGLINDDKGNVYDFFENTITNASQRERIENTVLIELTGKDNNGDYKNQKGKDAEC